MRHDHIDIFNSCHVHVEKEQTSVFYFSSHSTIQYQFYRRPENFVSFFSFSVLFVSDPIYAITDLDHLRGALNKGNPLL